MASAIIHLAIAKEVNKVLKRNEKEFLLGAIAPDIGKLVGLEKITTHLLDENRGRDIPNLERFLDKYKNTLNNDFNLGYYCHLYADMIWFGLFINNFESIDNRTLTYPDGSERTFSENEVTKLLYNDYTNLNIQVIDHYEMDLSLFYEEYPKINSEIDEIPIDKLNILIDKMGEIVESSKNRNTAIINPEFVYKYIEETVNLFLEDLKTLNII